MGNKIHPIAFRLGPLYTWTSRWFASDKNYKNVIMEDVKIRRALMIKLKTAGVARVEIERSINKTTIFVFVSRPGVVIGRGGSGLEDLKKYIVKDLLKQNPADKNASKIDLKVEQVKEPALDAYLVGVNIADQLAKRLPPKRVMKQAIEKAMASGAKGIKVRLGGRINGAEIARVETKRDGIIPLSTIKSRIDFAAVPAATRSGYIGVKVWICLPDEGIKSVNANNNNNNNSNTNTNNNNTN